MMDENSLGSSETFKSAKSLSDDHKLFDVQLNHHSLNNNQLDNNEQEIRSNENNFESNLKSEDLKMEDNLNNVILSNGYQSTSELLNEEIKFREQQKFDQHDDEESSKYESLDNSLSNLESNRETNDSTINNTVSKNTVNDEQINNDQTDNKPTDIESTNNDTIKKDTVNDQPTNNDDLTNKSIKNDLINENLTNNETKEAEFIQLFDNPDLLKRIIKKGNENVLKPEQSCEVLINIETRNQVTNELIESECEQNLTVLIGDFDIIHGVDLALLTMYQNEIAEILIKPLVGYGPVGKLPDIPSNCVLICKVELLKIVWPNEMACDSLNDLNHYFKLTIRKKERGNFFFKRQEFSTALHCYTKSVNLLDFVGQEMVNRHHLLTDSESKATDESQKKEIGVELNAINELSVEYMKVKLDVFNNLSAVNIKLKSYNQALDAVENALRVDPNDKKALFRKSSILSNKGCVEEAIDSLKHVLRLEPTNRIFLNELNKLKVRLKKEIKEEKALYSKMLQTQKAIKNKKKKTDQQFNYLATGLVLGGVVLGSFILYRKFVAST